MKVTTLVLNAEGEPHFQGEDRIHFNQLMEMSKPREQELRAHGAEIAAGGITFFGGEVLKAVATGENADVTKAIYQMVMAAWRFDSIFGGLTAAHYLESDLKFVIAADGKVTQSRIPASKS